MNERTVILDELGDPNAPVGSRHWCLYVANEIRKTVYDNQQNGQRLRDLVEVFKEQQGWQALGFLAWEDFCRKRLNSSPDELEVTITMRIVQQRAMQPAELATKSEAQKGNLNAWRVYDTNADAITKNDDSNQNNGFSHKPKFGENAAYLTARIARDRPDILEQMRQGIYRSVRAAAIDAGIIDPDKSRRYQLPTDPAAAGRYLAQRVDADWMLACYDAFLKHTGDDIE